MTAQTRQHRVLAVTKGKETHHHDLVYEICKTSIPGSSPGGASNLFRARLNRKP
jgi:hypothetical protein